MEAKASNVAASSGVYVGASSCAIAIGTACRDRDQREAHGSSHWRDHHHRPCALQMVVEAEQRHDAQEAGKVDDPGADDEGVARVVDVGDPLRTLAAGLRDQNLDTAGRHQRDTGDKTGDGQQRAHGATVERRKSPRRRSSASVACESTGATCARRPKRSA